jgi:G3E family GTPase
MPNLVPIDLITGFLGSGKTTLLKHVLQHGLNGQRVAVIVNDLADLNVDGQILRGLNVDKMVELTSGCVCCSGLYKLGIGLQEIVETAQPTLILIETSGAAAPGPVVSELATLGYRTDAIITVVDVEQFPRMMDAEPVVADQVADADFVVLNKLDLADASQLKKVRRAVSGINHRAHIVETSFGKVNSDLLFATGVRALRQTSNSRHSHPDGIESFVYETQDSFDRVRLERLLGSLPSNLYRVKGFIRITGESFPALLNYTCGRFKIDHFPSLQKMNSHTQIVFVGKSVRNHETSIAASLDRCKSSSTSRAFWRRF